MNVRNPYTAPAHKGAWARGYAAGLAGRPASDCPYDGRASVPVGRGRRPWRMPTARRGFANAWLRGHRGGAAERAARAEGERGRGRPGRSPRGNGGIP